MNAGQPSESRTSDTKVTMPGRDLNVHTRRGPEQDIVFYVVDNQTSRLLSDELEDLLESKDLQTVSDIPLHRCSYGRRNHKEVAQKRRETIRSRQMKLGAIKNGESADHKIFQVSSELGFYAFYEAPNFRDKIHKDFNFGSSALAFEDVAILRLWLNEAGSDVHKNARFLRIALVDRDNGGDLESEDFVSLLDDLSLRCPNVLHIRFYWFRFSRSARPNITASLKTCRLVSSLASLPGLKELRLKRENAGAWKAGTREIGGQVEDYGAAGRHLSLCVAYGAGADKARETMERIKWPETRVVWFDWISALLKLLV